MNNTNRRVFLTQAATLSCGAFCRDSRMVKTFAAALVPPNSESQLSGKSLLAKMKWLNEPASAKQTNDLFIVTTKPKTDFWRKTFYDYVTDNGHFLFLPVTGDFTFESRVAGKYAALYDQAGLMARIDSGNWLKCAILSTARISLRRASVICLCNRLWTPASCAALPKAPASNARSMKPA